MVCVSLGVSGVGKGCGCLADTGLFGLDGVMGDIGELMLFDLPCPFVIEESFCFVRLNSPVFSVPMVGDR